jgi:menaquinone-dependent protoporphyrinogen oxidase
VSLRRHRHGARGNLTDTVLVLFSTREGHTARIAERIAERLRGRGHRVDVVPAGAGIDASGYAGVIVGASVHYGRHPVKLGKWLKNARLEGRPSAFFSVSLGAKEHYAAKFLRRAGWQPQLTAVFRGALKYSRYGPIQRRVVQAFAAVAGHDTDTSQDYDYTDWKAVDSFATAFAALIT